VLAYLYIAMGMVAGAAVISLFSFLPRTHLSKFISPKNYNPDANLLFYGHLASYDAQTVLQALSHSAGAPGAEFRLLDQ